MTTQSQPTAVEATSVEVITGTTYPEPFREHVQGRRKRRLGDAFGVTDFGVNLVELDPGGWSSQRHWHSHEDEFLMVLEGEVTLITDGGEQTLRPGMIAGFPKNVPDGHHLVNKGTARAVYLEIGSRNPADEARYPDIDLVFRRIGAFTHRNGEPYP